MLALLAPLPSLPVFQFCLPRKLRRTWLDTPLDTRSQEGLGMEQGQEAGEDQVTEPRVAGRGPSFSHH